MSPSKGKPRLRIGAHTSIAGSLVQAARQAVAFGCNTFQIFSRSPRMWGGRQLDPKQIERLKEARAESDLTPLVIHGNYLINMASVDPEIRRKSIAAFRDELERARALGAEYLVIHPGSSRGQTPQRAARHLASSIARASRGIQSNGLTLLLENTAGGGHTMGRDFAELAELRERIQQKADLPVGFCVDTAHCFEAGFDLSTAEGLRETLGIIEETIGLDNVPVIHANDSRTPLGSRVDRHEHIGRGHIGREGFRRILNHPKLRHKAFILETPADEQGGHLRNVRALKTLARPRARAPRN